MPDNRTIFTEGIYLIDKPSGPTSHDIVNYVRRQSGIKRVGHAGTLDPLASGLLIILVGREFTKQQARFLKQDKSYLVSARLGLSTDTYDITGQVTAQATWEQVAPLTTAQIKTQLAQFQGQITQVTPAFAAVKIQGRKAYELARRGIAFERPSRQVEIRRCELLAPRRDEQAQNYELDLVIDCSSGTYIRSIVHDLGQALGVGATVTALRRTRIGELKVEDAMSIDWQPTQNRPG